jgi:hypoxanthine phosphoribosyltransferase
MKTKTFISSAEIADICKTLGLKITADYQGKEILAVVILKGSVVFAADLIRNINLPLELEFIRLSSYGNETTSSGKIEMHNGFSVPIEGKHVLVLEDILDTGNTLSFFKKYLEGLRPASIKICTFLNKPSRRVAAIEADYSGKTIDNHFVIGYGLDYQEKFRNYPDIHIVENV